MLNHPSASSDICALTGLEWLARDPLRLMTIEAYWREANEPLDVLEDREGEFSRAALELEDLCIRHRITYRPATDGVLPAFPAWAFREVYPANP